MCEESNNPKNTESNWKTRIKSLFVITVDDPLIICLENNDSAQAKIIACRKHIYLHKKKRRKKLKMAVLFLLLTISCIFSLVKIQQGMILQREIASIQAQSMHEFLSSTFDKHTVEFDEINGIVSINGININELSNDETSKIYNESSSQIRWSLFMMLCALVFLCMSLYNFAEIIMADSLKSYEDTIVQCEEEIDLLELKDPNVKEQIDDKRFKQHQRELKRYYDLNLKQTKSMYYLGVFVIIAGIAMILVTLFLFHDNTQENIIPIIVGSISGTLTDCIGFMFIKMYSQNMDASIKYHNKLVYSNNLLLSNVMVSRISNVSKKDETFSLMAQNTVKSTVEKIDDSIKEDKSKGS